jgi:cell division ATP-binding protein ftsE
MSKRISCAREKDNAIFCGFFNLCYNKKWFFSVYAGTHALALERNETNRMIRMKNVSKIYENGAVALDHVNIEIAKGEFVFVVGVSGAGKSTFIKMLFREELPTEGELFVNGHDVVHMDMTDVPYLRRGLGVIFQDYRLLSDKTVYENVAFAMRVIEAPRQMIQRRVNAVLDVVGLRDKYRDFPSQLSGGEQQRVAIARAIVNDPAILIADEPTGNLDPETSWDIMDIFKRINAAGTTIVMATHDKNIVDTMQRRVVAIEDGKIVRDEQRGGYGYEN